MTDKCGSDEYKKNNNLFLIIGLLTAVLVIVIIIAQFIELDGILFNSLEWYGWVIIILGVIFAGISVFIYLRYIHPCNNEYNEFNLL